MRLRDAEALKTIKSIQSADFNSIETIRRWIDSAPTIDTIIDIVRCKDCKFSESVITSWSTDGKNNVVERLCKVHKWSVKDNDFCSYGERSEE